MTIYTDGTHLVADTLAELHEFAQGIGLKRAWFQISTSGYPHYDMTTKRMRARALRRGALMASRRHVLKLCRQLKTEMDGG